MRYLFTRRFNLLDSLTLTSAAPFLYDGRYLVGVAILIGGLLVSCVGEAVLEAPRHPSRAG